MSNGDDTKKKNSLGLVRSSVSGQFSRDSKTVRNAMSGGQKKGGIFGSNGGDEKLSKKPKATARYNIRIDKKAGGFAARVSVGTLLGKHKDYLAETLEDLFVDIKASAKRTFAAGADDIAEVDQPDWQPESGPAETVEAEMVEETTDNTTKCPKCGAMVEYESSVQTVEQQHRRSQHRLQHQSQ